MEIVLDIGAVIVFLLVVPSVVWAVRKESGTTITPALAAFVALFIIIMGVVFMSAASQLATGGSSTQIVLLIFFIVIAIFARLAFTSKMA